MNPIWAAAGAVVGLLAGAALRRPVFQLSVATGTAERRACPRCGRSAGWWMGSRCEECGEHLGTPLVLEVAAAGVLALLFGRFGGQAELLAFGFFGALGVGLAAIDISVQRLPDKLTLPAYPVLVALLAIAAVFGHDSFALVRALLGGLALGGGYLLLALLWQGQIGGGDVKLAGLTGLVLGFLGWATLIAGAVFGLVLSAVVSLALLAARRVKLHSAISFGPFMLGGALLAMLASRR